MTSQRPRSSILLLHAWIASSTITILAHNSPSVVDAFSFHGRSSSPAMLVAHQSTRIGHARVSSSRPGGGGCNHRRIGSTQRRRGLVDVHAAVGITSLCMGLEDAIFAAQSIGSSLANAVISSSATSSAAASASSSSSSAATVVFDVVDSVKSLAALYAAGLWTSFSPCSLGLLPITVSYISNAVTNDDDRGDETNTIVPTLAYAAGLATVFTALGVSASALGGVFGGNNFGGGGGFSALVLAAVASLVSVLMGLQLLELIRLPLPSLDFRLRRTAMAFEGGGRRRRRGGNGGGNGSLFDENGGLVLGATVVVDGLSADDEDDDAGDGYDAASVLLRTFLLGGTSALVASPCATPVLTSLLAYMASASSTSATSGDVWRGASWMLSYTLGYSTPLLVAGATGGQALANLRRERNHDGGGFSGLSASVGRWVNPLTGGVLIAFGMNGLLLALLGDPSVSALAPIID